MPNFTDNSLRVAAAGHTRPNNRAATTLAMQQYEKSIYGTSYRGTSIPGNALTCTVSVHVLSPHLSYVAPAGIVLYQPQRNMSS